MNAKISIISLLLILIMPIHSIALDVGVPIEVEADSGLFTVTKLRDIGFLSFFLDPQCGGVMAYTAAEFDEKTKTTTNSLAACACTTEDGSEMIEYSQSGNCELVKLLSNNKMAEYLIESDSGASLTISQDISPKTIQFEKTYGQINAGSNSIICYDEEGELIESGPYPFLRFDSYKKAYCYLPLVSRIEMIGMTEIDHTTVLNLTITVNFSY